LEAPLIFFGIKLCLVIVFPVAFALVRTSALPMLPYTYTTYLFVLLGVRGFYAPSLWVKLKAQLIFFIFPSVFVVIMGPANIQIMRILLPTLSRQ
jgi:hypothetical protein